MIIIEKSLLLHIHCVRYQKLSR